MIALQAATYQQAAADLTDASGHYDIHLDAGSYKLAFYDPTSDHQMEWYDNQPASGLGSATSVTAVVGTPTTTNVELTPSTGTIAGTVTETGSGDPLDATLVVAISTTGTITGAVVTAGDGTYTMDGLKAGSHRLRFLDPTGAHVSEYYDGSATSGGATAVGVDGGTTTSGIDAALST